MAGVTRVEPFRWAPARLHFGHRAKEVSLQGVTSDGVLRRIIDGDGRVQPIPPTGLVLSTNLADDLGVVAGETLGVEILEGERRHDTIKVAGVVDGFLGVSATMSLDALQSLLGSSRGISGAYLSVMADEVSALERRLKFMPAVAGVASPGAMLASFQKQMDESLFVGIGFLLGFAGVIAMAVVYNGARISLSERGRELASLRVMGFRRARGIRVAVGRAGADHACWPYPWAGHWGTCCRPWSLRSLQTDAYSIPFVINSQSYRLSAVIVIVAAAASAMLVQRRINHLDLIEVLKTRE